MFGILGDKFAEGLDRGILIAGFPLLGGKEHGGATGGRGSGVVLGHLEQIGERLRLREILAGAVGLALLHALEDDPGTTGNRDEDAEDNHALLVAVQKRLKGGGAVRNFGERARGIVLFYGHVASL